MSIAHNHAYTSVHTCACMYIIIYTYACHLSDGPWSLRVHGGIWASSEGVLARHLFRQVFGVLSRVQWLDINTLQHHQQSGQAGRESLVGYLKHINAVSEKHLYGSIVKVFLGSPLLGSMC